MYLDKKRELEDLFRLYDEDVTFQWLRSFRRLRVNFQTPFAAASARIQLHQYKINESVITCYFAQPVTPVKNPNLQPPAPYKQFLISPPASPPLDWEPRPEGEPIINQDLLAALATLTPGGSHELHPPSPGQPSIVVHTALGKQKIKFITCKYNITTLQFFNTFCMLLAILPKPNILLTDDRGY